jgi:hypothetical protein
MRNIAKNFTCVKNQTKGISAKCTTTLWGTEKSLDTSNVSEVQLGGWFLLHYFFS